MAQTIEEQLEIMKAYADGKPVYRRSKCQDVGKKVEAVGHEFNFEYATYSLTPMDWCTGTEAIAAYETFMRTGSESTGSPEQYFVKYTRSDGFKQNEYERKAIDAFDTYSIFIAGAEWVLRNQDRALKNNENKIDIEQSLKKFRDAYENRQSPEYPVVNNKL